MAFLLDTNVWSVYYPTYYTTIQGHKNAEKSKISLTIDEETIRAIESASQKQRKAKSHIAQKAFELWLKRETELLMAKGYEEMAEEDRTLAETTFDAQKEIVS